LESRTKEFFEGKELGITAARVPSSSLDKITAEFLESHFKPAAAPSHPPVPHAPEPILLVTAPSPGAPETIPPPPVRTSDP